MKKREAKVSFRLERTAADSLPRTDEDLSELERRACEGDPEAIERLVCSCVPFAWKYFVNRDYLQNGYYCREDGLQNAMLKLLAEVIENYDWRKGHFKHYVSRWLPGCMIKTSLDSAKHGMTYFPRNSNSDSDGDGFYESCFISINAPVFDDEGVMSGEFGDTLAAEEKTLEEKYCDKQLSDIINTVLFTVLTQEERIAIELYFGFQCAGERLYDRRKLNSLINKGLLKIRSSSYMYQLKEFYAA